jgi:hypothetical protein
MNRRDAETPREDWITGEIIGAGIEVHRELGPGLLESAYEECIGLLLNFNVPVLKDGLKRIVNNYLPSSASPRLGG